MNNKVIIEFDKLGIYNNVSIQLNIKHHLRSETVSIEKLYINNGVGSINTQLPILDYDYLYQTIEKYCDYHFLKPYQKINTQTGVVE